MIFFYLLNNVHKSCQHLSCFSHIGVNLLQLDVGFQRSPSLHSNSKRRQILTVVSWFVKEEEEGDGDEEQRQHHRKAEGQQDVGGSAGWSWIFSKTKTNVFPSYK